LQQRIDTALINPRNPNQNTCIEQGNLPCLHEVFDTYLFEEIDQVFEIAEDWSTIFNEELSHWAMVKMPRPRLLRQQTEKFTSLLST
jgi:hypothetical protein